MAVIINDFEIVVEQPPERSGGEEDGAAAEGQSSQPTPQDIEMILRRQMERTARVHAD